MPPGLRDWAALVAAVVLLVAAVAVFAAAFTALFVRLVGGVL